MAVYTASCLLRDNCIFLLHAGFPSISTRNMIFQGSLLTLFPVQILPISPPGTA